MIRRAVEIEGAGAVYEAWPGWEAEAVLPSARARSGNVVEEVWCLLMPRRFYDTAEASARKRFALVGSRGSFSTSLEAPGVGLNPAQQARRQAPRLRFLKMRLKRSFFARAHFVAMLFVLYSAASTALPASTNGE